MNLGQESEFVEFKKTTSEMREGMTAIAAILNKHGRGELYFGVKNDGEVSGQDVSEATLRKIGQAIAGSVKPAIYPLIEALDDAGRRYIRVAFTGFETPYACKGKYFIRVADSDMEMSQEELSRLFLYARAREVPWDQWESSRPVAAVREALYNAFTHRDRLSGASVQVEIYSDSVEISNPGWFIEGQDPAAHISGADNSPLSRNMLIAQTLYKSGDIESFGTGIPRIREACEAAGINFEYARTANGTKFIFHRNEAFEGEVPASSGKFRQVPASSDNGLTSSDKFRQVPISSDKLTGGIAKREGLSVEEQQACKLMAEKGPMRSAEIAAIAGLTQRGAQKLLARLVERGLVVTQGGAKRNRTYKLKDDLGERHDDR